MTTFSDPDQVFGDGQVKPSPNGLYYALVTSRGLVKTNQIESSLWLFDAADLLREIDHPGLTFLKPPRSLTIVRAEPVREAIEPYQAVITDLRWAPDSASLYFLGQDNHGARHLNQVFVGGRHSRVLSDFNVDVRRYDVGGTLVVYTAVKPRQKPARPRELPGRPINSVASSIVDLPLERVLFIDRTIVPQAPQLWVVRHGFGRRIKTAMSLPAELEGPWDVLSVSPDGTRAVLLVSCQNIKPFWESFVPATGFETRKIGETNSRSISPDNPFRLRQYVIVNLQSGRIEFSQDAPYGISLAYQDRVGAAWSRDSSHVLLGNTFMPDVTGSRQHTDYLRPCAVVDLELVAHEQVCVVPTRDDTSPTPSNPNPLRLKDFSFADSRNAVVLGFAGLHNEHETETYQIDDAQPRLLGYARGDSRLTVPESHKKISRLAVEIRQGLNTRPTLWAKDAITGTMREIWDPNPQLKNLTFGKVSIYKWTDATGFEWTGGLVLPVNYLVGRLYPLVIQTHGFRKDQFMTDGEYPTAMAAQPLANTGIVVLQVGGRGDHMLEQQEALDQVEGYSAAVKRLALDGIVDPRKVGIIGFSRTCWYTEVALSNHPGLFLAATLADGIDEGYMDYILFPEHVAAESEKIHGGRPFGERLTSWIQSSPTSQLGHLRSAVRIEAMSPISVLGRWELYSTLRLQNKAVDFIYIPNGQHILQRPLDRLASQQGNVDWFRFWLQDYEDPDTTKCEQHRRWEAMRLKMSAAD